MKEISLDLIEEDLKERLEPYIVADIKPIVVVVRSFFKDEEWVDYLTYILDVGSLKHDFKSVLERHFNVLYVGATSGVDLFAVIVPKENEIVDTVSELTRRVEAMEDDMISVFLGPEYLGRIQKQVDIFKNPFKTMVEFAIGYSFLKSTSVDDIIESVKLALGRADMRRRIKVDELTRELYYILDSGNVETYFQPIIDVKNKSIYAYEALVRGPKGSPLRRPDLLFKVAYLNHVELDLDRMVRRIHIENFKRIYGDSRGKLSLNLGPVTPMFIEDVDRDLKGASIPKEYVIWEVSEKTYIDDFTAFSRTIDFLVSSGYHVAVDDFGAGATTFKLIFSINTQLIKIDRSFIESVNTDQSKQMFLERLIGCFYRPDTLLIVEGLETREEFGVLLDIGYRYFQGYYLAMPSPDPIKDDDLKALLKDVSPDVMNMKFSGYFLT